MHLRTQEMGESLGFADIHFSSPDKQAGKTIISRRCVSLFRCDGIFFLSFVVSVNIGTPYHRDSGGGNAQALRFPGATMDTYCCLSAVGADLLCVGLAAAVREQSVSIELFRRHRRRGDV